MPRLFSCVNVPMCLFLRMLDENYRDQIEEIVKFSPKGRQTMLFSATMTDEVNYPSSCVHSGTWTYNQRFREDLLCSSLVLTCNIFFRWTSLYCYRWINQWSCSLTTAPMSLRIWDKNSSELRKVARKIELRLSLVNIVFRLFLFRIWFALSCNIFDIVSFLALCCRGFHENCLVFVPTKQLAHRVRISLGLLGVNAEELHGNLTQLQVSTHQGRLLMYLLHSQIDVAPISPHLPFLTFILHATPPHNYPFLSTPTCPSHTSP